MSSQPVSPAAPTTNRLARFRDMMSRLDAAGDPSRALARDLYVSFPGGASEKIAGRLELRPASTHLLVGGVGSGKTTELLKVRARLAETDVKAIYIDVSSRHDLAKMKPGVVFLQAAIALTRFAYQLSKARGVMNVDAGKATNELENIASGHVHPRRTKDILDRGYEYREGALAAPGPEFGALTSEVRAIVAPILAPVAEEIGTRAVVLLDGLDRLTDVEIFRNLVDDDVKALTSLGVGVVLVGPLKCLYRLEKETTGSFDYVSHQPYRDSINDAEEKHFLTEVLRHRLNGDELDDDALNLLVSASGGVLRDLIALAQLACEDAYLNGADRVGVAHAKTAVQTFARKHLLGIQTDELETLQTLRQRGAFVHTSDLHLGLLMTRRVLEYTSKNGPHYAVHPSIRGLLAAMAGEA